jgi:probable selenium-dependent hydroxylase accessory protein YqeC
MNHRTPLLNYLDSFIHGSVVSLTGSGGKTSLLKKLGAYERSLGKSVLLTTTTKLGSPNLVDYAYDSIYLDDSIISSPKAKGTTEFLAWPFSSDKVCSPPFELISRLVGLYDIILIEADGAKHLPLKLHGPHEPVVIPQTTTTIAMAGIREWGNLANPSNFFNFQMLADSILINEDLIALLLDSPNGLLKNAVGRKIVLVNQAEIVTAAVDYSRFRKYFEDTYLTSIKENWIELT